MKRSALPSILAACLFLAGPLAPFPSVGSEATFLAEQAGFRRGLCAVLGAGDGSLPLALAEENDWLVHVREPDSSKVASLRRLADDAGLPIQRLIAEEGSWKPLPYADNTIDFLVHRSGDGDGSGSIDASEILRVLRPEGIALVRGDVDPAKAGGIAVTPVEFEGKAWTRIVKPVPEGLDEWSHWEKAPDNNPVSTDVRIKAPYMTQFMAKPWYIGMPAVTTAAGGRTFLAMGHIAHHEREWDMLNRLVARNGYNGTILWERDLPPDYLVHRSAFIATKDTFHMINGDHCLLLDARTGEEKGALRIPGFPGDWKWMAMVDGVLYVLAGAPGDGVELVKGNRELGGWSWADLSKGYYGKHPHGFGDAIAAWDLEARKVLWIHREDSLIDSRGLAIRDDSFFLYCPEKYFRCLDRTTGEELWRNEEKLTLEMIEEPGKGLTSTPGWRTQSMVVATPKSLVIQGQTRMNVIGISSENGEFLWQKRKVTNNPNAIYVDGKVVLGVGERGSHIVIDPVTGTVEDNLNFFKRACTRLTASTDSFFVRGEGMTRFDRASKNVQIDGAVRPACNDGVIPAHGLLYLGPWACDCNLSLIGNVARTSAGNFSFDNAATSRERLEREEDPDPAAPLEVTPEDWPTHRGDARRSGGSPVAVGRNARVLWHHEPVHAHVPTDATAAGELVFVGGEDGKVRALDTASGEPRWTFATAGAVKYPPTLAGGRAFFGSGDGHAYCLEAVTGRLLWKFRAAPVERHIMVYGTMSSTWPVNTGILVEGGRAFFGAGIVDHDGTCVCALDAATGEIAWENNSSGHLNPELRKGVSAQGTLTLHEGNLVLAGGNVVSPAAFDIETGRCLETPREQGQPQSNGGKFVGVFGDGHLVAGGRILYSSPRNVSTKGSFDVWSGDRKRFLTLNYGGIPPAWNESVLASANFKYGKVTAFDAETLTGWIGKGFEDDPNNRNRFSRNLVTAISARGEERWQSSLGGNSRFEALSLAVAPNAIVTVARYQDLRRATPQFFLTGLRTDNGAQLFQVELPGEPLPGALAIDRNGRMLVSLLDGGIVCVGE